MRTAILARIALYFCEGASDKRYAVTLEETTAGCLVNFEHGRLIGEVANGTIGATIIGMNIEPAPRTAQALDALRRAVTHYQASEKPRLDALLERILDMPGAEIPAALSEHDRLALAARHTLARAFWRYTADVNSERTCLEFVDLRACEKVLASDAA